jgi:transcriptional regulator with XRE-family HTH domain/KaiC/GvpD/RAD55 family RecA-like ATPase
MDVTKKMVTSGVRYADLMLGGGIIIGDNVIWYDDAGSLAAVFALNLLRASIEKKKSVIYINFDHSPKSLLEKLGPMAKYKSLVILDCFTDGRGKGSDIFSSFYSRKRNERLCQFVRVDAPDNPDHVMGAFYGLHKTMKGDVRFVFDSFTGMQELWGGEEAILKFYAHSCPRLYELNTIAYWIVEKGAHSHRLRANLNQITQVAIDLSLKRGKTSFTVLKADQRDLNVVNKTATYRTRGLDVVFEGEQGRSEDVNIGLRLKELRTRKGLSQTEMARLVGVTPSTISQVERSQIYPSLPALFKMAEILSVEVGALFRKNEQTAGRVVFPAGEAVAVQLPGVARESLQAVLLTGVGHESRVEPYLIELPPKTKLPVHFFAHKGEEIGYLLSGKLNLKLGRGIQVLSEGDTICLKSEIPQQWENKGAVPAKLLWLKIK